MKNRLSILKWSRLVKRVIRFLKDKGVSKHKKLLFILPIIYLISPVDLVSDFLPILGWLDDAAILTIVWNFFLQEVKDYEKEQNMTYDESNEDSKENEIDKDKDYTLSEDDYKIE
jgi:uncharacterized membrane protein YkvA (DUF1232 family)